MAKKCSKKVDDEKDKHPFYSDWGIKEWKKRIKELELQEKELSKRRPQTNGKSVQEEPAEETIGSES